MVYVGRTAWGRRGVCVGLPELVKEDFPDSVEITLDPLPFFEVRKDLIVDMDEFL